MNRKPLVKVVTGSDCPRYNSQQISPADDLQIPGRCGVEFSKNWNKNNSPNMLLGKQCNVSTRFMLS